MEEVEKAGRETWRIRLDPDGVPSAYQWVEYWFDQERPVVVAADFYRDGNKVRSLLVDQESVEEIDGRFVPTRMTFRGERTETSVQVSDVQIREYDDKFFSTLNLRKTNRP